MTIFEIYLVVIIAVLAAVNGIQRYFWLETLKLNRELLDNSRQSSLMVAEIIVRFLEDNNVDPQVVKCIKAAASCSMNSQKNNVVERDSMLVNNNVESPDI